MVEPYLISLENYKDCFCTRYLEEKQAALLRKPEYFKIRTLLLVVLARSFHDYSRQYLTFTDTLILLQEDQNNKNFCFRNYLNI